MRPGKSTPYPNPYLPIPTVGPNIPGIQPEEEEEWFELEDFSEFEEEPIDILLLSADWMDDGMRAVFAAGAILGAINYLNQAMAGARSVAIFGFFWNYFDALGGVLAAIEGYRNAANAKRHKKEKCVLASVELFGSIQLTVGSTLAILAMKGVLVGTAATVVSPFGVITFAASMALETIKEVYLLLKTIKKNKPEYLIKDHLIKCHHLEKKLEKLKKDRKANAAEILKLEKQQNVLYLQAMSIAKVTYFDNAKPLPKAIFQCTELKGSIYTYELINSRMSASTEVDREFVKFIKDNQHVKVRRHTFGVVTWGLASIGMLLIAVGTVCPPLMIPGVVIALVAGGLKLAEILEVDKHVYNLFAKNKVEISKDNFIVNSLARCEKRQEVYQEYKVKIANIPKKHKGETLDDETRVKLHLAYQLSRKNRKDGHFVPENQFCKGVMNLSWWKRRSILNGAMDKYIENETLKESCSFADKLSEKDHKRIVDSSLRKNYRFFSKFHTQSDISQSDSTNSLDSLDVGTQPGLLV